MPNVKINDRGTYSVRAQNKGGEAQSFCTLVVSPPVNYVQHQLQIPPTFLQHVENQTLLPGGTARFETLVDGTPTPQVNEFLNYLWKEKYFSVYLKYYGSSFFTWKNYVKYRN